MRLTVQGGKSIEVTSLTLGDRTQEALVTIRTVDGEELTVAVECERALSVEYKRQPIGQGTR